MENVIVIGSGPAASSAALFTKEFSPLLFEGEIIDGIGPGGQLTITTDVDNYPGFPNGVQGPDLMDIMRQQLLDSGARIISKTVSKVEKKKDHFVVSTEKDSYKTRCIIVATGASARRLKVPGTSETEFWQKGISACAVCDGYFYKDKVVAIIGGGDSALEETLYMSNIASKVYLVHRRHGFRAREDKMEKARKNKKIEIVTPAELVSANGDDILRSITLINKEKGENFDLKVDGLFFAIGHDPNSKFLGELLAKDENGYLQTNKSMETSVKGIFACGDVQDFVFKQAITAAATGAVAGRECCRYLSDRNDKK